MLVERKEDRGMNGTPLGKRAALWKRAVGAQGSHAAGRSHAPSPTLYKTQKIVSSSVCAGTLPSPFHQTAKAALQESHTPGPTPEKQRPPGFFFHKQASQAQTADGVISFELPVKVGDLPPCHPPARGRGCQSCLLSLTLVTVASFPLLKAQARLTTPFACPPIRTSSASTTAIRSSRTAASPSRCGRSASGSSRAGKTP